MHLAGHSELIFKKYGSKGVAFSEIIA